MSKTNRDVALEILDTYDFFSLEKPLKIQKLVEKVEEKIDIKPYIKTPVTDKKKDSPKNSSVDDPLIDENFIEKYQDILFPSIKKSQFSVTSRPEENLQRNEPVIRLNNFEIKPRIEVQKIEEEQKEAKETLDKFTKTKPQENIFPEQKEPIKILIQPTISMFPKRVEKEERKETQSQIKNLPVLTPKTKKVPKTIIRNYQEITEYLSKFSNNEEQNFIYEKLEVYILKKTRGKTQSINEIITKQKIINSIKTKKVKLSSFQGPFLFGSYNSSTNLPDSSIDILFTSDRLALMDNNEKAIKGFITSILDTFFKLEPFNINYSIKTKEFTIFIEVKLKDISTRIHFFLVDTSNKIKEKKLKLISLGKNPCNTSEISEKENNKLIACKILRVWIRRWGLSFILPEILDEIVSQTFCSTVSLTFVKIMYNLYIGEFRLRDISGKSERISLMNEEISKWYEKEKQKQILQNACKETTYFIAHGLIKRAFE